MVGDPEKSIRHQTLLWRFIFSHGEDGKTLKKSEDVKKRAPTTQIWPTMSKQGKKQRTHKPNSAKKARSPANTNRMKRRQKNRKPELRKSDLQHHGAENDEVGLDLEPEEEDK